MPTTAMMLSGAAVGGGGVAGFTTITIDHTKCGASNTSDYPLTVVGTYAALKGSGSGGTLTSVNNLAFYSDAGHTTLLKFERVFHSLTTGKIEYHVKIPTLDVSSDVVIYPFVDIAEMSDRADTPNSWDSGFKQVSHFGDGTTLSLADSTTNANNGTNAGAGLLAASAGAFASGTLGGACTFSAGSRDDLGTSSSLSLPGDATTEAWIKPQQVNPPSSYFIVYTGDNTLSGIQFGFEWSRPANKIDLLQGTAGGGTDNLFPANTLTDLAWHHVGMTRSGATSVRFYIDGVADVGNPQTASHTLSSFVRAYIGSWAGFFDFAWPMDEVRISNVVRTASYFTATFNNQSSPSTFYTVT